VKIERGDEKREEEPGRGLSLSSLVFEKRADWGGAEEKAAKTKIEQVIKGKGK